MSIGATERYIHSASGRAARESASIRTDLAQFSMEGAFLQRLLIEQRKKEQEFHENLGFEIRTGERSSGRAMTERQRIYFVDDIALIPLQPGDEPDILKLVEDKIFAAVLRKYGRSVTDESYGEAPGELAAKFAGQDPALSSSYIGWLETFDPDPPELSQKSEEEWDLTPDEEEIEITTSGDMHHELLKLGSGWEKVNDPVKFASILRKYTRNFNAGRFEAMMGELAGARLISQDGLRQLQESFDKIKPRIPEVEYSRHATLTDILFWMMEDRALSVSSNADLFQWRDDPFLNFLERAMKLTMF